MEDTKKHRILSGRVSKSQKYKLIELMKQHQDVAKGQFGSKTGKQDITATWNAIAEDLNGMGGSCKNAEQWKKSWADWKSSVKKQYAQHRAFANRTGNLPSSEGPKPIDALDQEVLQFFANDMVEGDNSSPEGGFSLLEVSVEEFQQPVHVEEELFIEPQEIVPLKTKAADREPPGKSIYEEAKMKVDEHHTEIMLTLRSIENLLINQNELLNNINASLSLKHYTIFCLTKCL